MTNSILINDKSRTIEITKKFAAAAKYYNTTEYDELQAVRKDYPNYRVQIKTVTKKADHFKGLSFDFMQKYIKNHKEELLSDFFILSGKNEKEGNKRQLCSCREVVRRCQVPDSKIRHIG